MKPNRNRAPQTKREWLKPWPSEMRSTGHGDRRRRRSVGNFFFIFPPVYLPQKNCKKKKTFSRNFLLLRTQEEEEGGDRSLTVPTYANDRLRSPPLNKEEEKIEISLVDSLRPVVG